MINSSNTNEFLSAFKYASIGMAIVSLEGKWVKVNKSICNIVGYTEEELLQTDFQTITHPDSLGDDLQYVQQMLDKKIDYYEMEKQYIHKKGHTVWVLLSVSLVFDEGDNPKYFISQIQDIDARKKAENKLREYTNNLEVSHQQLEEFVHIVSHDLKEPLRGASYYNSLISDDCSPLSPSLKKLLNSQSILLKKMSDLLDHLLYYSQIGCDHLSFSKVNIKKIVNSVIHENLKVLIKENNVKIIVANTLPILENCDPFKIEEVFQNLISNAIKYNLSTSKKVTIGFDKKKKFYFVADNGVGIQIDNSDNIYRIFKRAHDSKDLPSGSGVGLSIVKRIIERHNGKIWCEPAPHCTGTKFCFTLNV
ncbi:MAG: PAS domain S-box protein [Rickettsiales bacterium]